MDLLRTVDNWRFHRGRWVRCPYCRRLARRRTALGCGWCDRCQHRFLT